MSDDTTQNKKDLNEKEDPDDTTDGSNDATDDSNDEDRVERAIFGPQLAQNTPQNVSYDNLDLLDLSLESSFVLNGNKCASHFKTHEEIQERFKNWRPLQKNDESNDNKDNNDSDLKEDDPDDAADDPYDANDDPDDAADDPDDDQLAQIIAHNNDLINAGNYSDDEITLNFQGPYQVDDDADETRHNEVQELVLNYFLKDLPQHLIWPLTDFTDYYK